MTRPLSRRAFLTQATVLTGGAVILSACTSGNSTPPKGVAGGAAKGLPDIEGGVVVTDPAAMPTKLDESPDFARLVKAGTLPPVVERVGQDPLVIKPLHGIGKYGGQIRRGYTGTGDFQNANRFCAGPDNLLYWDYKRENVVPNVARGYEISKDGRELILHLRRGMRWSDGHPFTADDILFWREDINLNPDLSSGSSALRLKGQNVRVEKVDEVTVRFASPFPNFLLPMLLAGWTDIGGHVQWGATGGGAFAPKHYLEKFLPKNIGEARAIRQAKAAGFPSWPAYVLHLNDWTQNLDLPVVTPWRLSRPINDPPWELTANPYSIWVDSEGNQLPYIPKITMAATESAVVLNVKAIAGEFDFQDRSLALDSLQVLIKNEDKGQYKIRQTPSSLMDFGLRVNLAYDKDPTLGELIRNVDFRRALSLGIDRDEINQTFFFGTSTPTSTMVDVDSPYFPGMEWRTKWATHDVAHANELLDKIGLTAKDGEGYRMRPDGMGRIRLNNQSVKTFGDFPAMGEMIKRQWKSIGIDMNVETINAQLQIQRALSGDLMLSGTPGIGTDDPFLNTAGFLLTSTSQYQGMIGIPYARWYATGGKSGKPLPDSLSPFKEAMDLYGQGQTADKEERVRIGKQLYQMHVDQVWSIGIVGFGLISYGFYLAKNTLGNVPARVLSNDQQKAMSNTLPMTFFYQ